ncbi:MAG: ribonuclease P protein subunit [Candidatus Micrarchaeia archaeon]
MSDQKKSIQSISINSKLKNLKYLIEYIGLTVEVINSSSPEQIGIKGLVVDETKNTFKIEKKDGKEVLIPKKGSTFLFRKGGETFTVEGSKILYPPEERLKKIKFE